MCGIIRLHLGEREKTSCELNPAVPRRAQTATGTKNLNLGDDPIEHRRNEDVNVDPHHAVEDRRNEAVNVDPRHQSRRNVGGMNGKLTEGDPPTTQLTLTLTIGAQYVKR